MDQTVSFNFGMVSPTRTFKAENLNTHNSQLISSKLGQSLNDDDFGLQNIKANLITNARSLRSGLLTPMTGQKSLYYQLVSALKGGDIQDSLTGFHKIYTEYPVHINPTAMSNMNTYKYVYKNRLKTVLELAREKEGGEVKAITTDSDVTMSMFNPIYMVNVRGISANVPLLHDPKSSAVNNDYSYNISDCTIKELVSLSHKDNSILGNARYRYADFMYCKDLGKMSNNHLITLRVFPYPIGDHIFEMAGPKYYDKKMSYTNPGDIGRLVTWFGTDDNKLEDILTYDYNATWKEFGSEIQEVNSKEDNTNSRGPAGMFINTLTAGYNDSVGAGYGGAASMWNYLGGSPTKFDSPEVLGNYDQHKIYTPTDTVQATHVYEGKLEFNHEFTLNFCYKLRAYDSINPKSAFLDLLGNIFAVTYRRGHFWGGDRKWIGPPQNKTAWNMVNSFVDGKFDEMGGIFQSLIDNNFDLSSLMGALGDIGNMFKNSISEIMDTASKQFDYDPNASIRENISNIATNLKDKRHVGEAIKGCIKNMLGRPAQYALNSLLKGDDVGLWHVTIGNPKNPIASIGNLILKKASITHSGVLGIDDFPSELKVSVTLAHGRGRDAVEISRMYTKGLNGIYLLPKANKLADFFHIHGDSQIDESSANLLNEFDKEAAAKLQAPTQSDATNAPNMNPMNEIYLPSVNKNIMIDKTAARYEWYGQSYLTTLKQVIREIA